MQTESRKKAQEKYRSTHLAQEKARQRTYREKHKEALSAKKRSWYYANRERAKRVSLAWYRANKDHVAEYKRRCAYGLPAGAFDERLVAQNRSCVICYSPFGATRNIHTDHDHVTHRFRGLLCSHCNRGLGYFRDNPLFLRVAADYLERHNGPK